MKNETIQISNQMQIAKNENFIIREELNLAKLPIFLPNHTKRKSLTVKKRINENEKQTIIVGIMKDSEGKKIEVGCLNIFDYKIYLFMVFKYKQSQNKFDDIEFTFNEIIQFLELKSSGQLVNNIKDSLEKLKKIPIDFSSFIYKNKHEYFEKKDYINILSVLSLAKLEDTREKREKHRCKFHEYLINNLDFNYTKPLLFNEINKLKNDYSIILYRYLDIVFASNNLKIFHKTWKQLALELYMPYNTNPRIKQFLIPALEELKGKHISTGIISDFKIEKTEVFILKKTIHQIAVNEIDKDGFNIKLVKELKAKYGDEVVEHSQNAILARKDKITNLNAFLTQSLKNDYKFAATSEEKQTEQKEIAEKYKTNKKEKEKIEFEKLKQEEQEQIKYKNIFNSFSEYQRGLIRQVAITRIETKTNKKHQQDNKTDKLFFNDLMIENEVIEILKEAEAISNKQ